MIPLLLTVVLLILNGFFVAWEFGLVGSRREKIEPLALDSYRHFALKRMLKALG